MGGGYSGQGVGEFLNILGGTIGGILAAGDKPVIPQFQPIDTTKEQGTAIAGNLQNLPAAQRLGSQVNAFNQAELEKMLSSVIPDFKAIMAQGSSDLASQLRGEIPKDVQNQIKMSTAERSTAGGFGGSTAAGNLTARDLGLTSLSIMNNAMDSATRWMAGARANATAPTFDVTSMFLTPQQRVTQATYDRDKKFERDLLAAGVAASPDPVMAGAGMGAIAGASQSGSFAPLWRQTSSGGGGGGYNLGGGGGTGGMYFGSQGSVPDNFGSLNSAQQQQYASQYNWARGYEASFPGGVNPYE